MTVPDQTQKMGEGLKMKVFQKSGNADPGILQGIGEPTGILFIAPHSVIEKMAAMVYEAFPNVPSVGGEGYHVVDGEVSEEKVSVLAFYEQTQIACGIIENVKANPILQAERIEQERERMKATAGNSVLIEYVSGHEERLASTLEAVLSSSGIQVAGGTSFGAPLNETSYVAYNGKVYGDSCAWALVKNLSGGVRVYTENIYTKGDSPAHYVTKADPDKNILYCLDGKKFGDVYCEELGLTKSQVLENTMVNPMGRRVGEKFYTASMKDFNQADGSVLMFKRLNLNDCVYFLSLDDYQESERNMVQKIRDSFSHVSLIYSVDCAYRYVLYQSKGYLNEYCKNLAGISSHFGFFCGGEQNGGQHVNQTAIYAVFE